MNKRHRKEYLIQYRKDNPDQFKQWKKDNPNKIKIIRKRYQLKCKISKEHIKKNKIYHKFNYLKEYSINKWIDENCALCNSNIQIEAHHENYDLPYSIIFLCGVCHKKIHRR